MFKSHGHIYEKYIHLIREKQIHISDWLLNDKERDSVFNLKEQVVLKGIVGEYQTSSHYRFHFKW